MTEGAGKGFRRGGGASVSIDMSRSRVQDCAYSMQETLVVESSQADCTHPIPPCPGKETVCFQNSNRYLSGEGA